MYETLKIHVFTTYLHYLHLFLYQETYLYLFLPLLVTLIPSCVASAIEAAVIHTNYKNESMYETGGWMGPIYHQRSLG